MCHVLRCRTFVDPRLILLEFRMSRAKRFICQIHCVFPTAAEVQQSGASCRHHDSSVHILHVSLLFCPPARQLYRTESLLPPRNAVRSATLRHNKTGILQLNEAVTLLHIAVDSIAHGHRNSSTLVTLPYITTLDFI